MNLVCIVRNFRSGGWSFFVHCDRYLDGLECKSYEWSRVVTLESAREDYGVVVPVKRGAA